MMNKNNVSTSAVATLQKSPASFIPTNSIYSKPPKQFSIKEVKTKEEATLFLNLPDDIHQSNPAYIKPLNKDIEAVFNESQNKFFQHGKCTRWLLFDEKNILIGRIAVFINNEYQQHQPTGGIGFFDCIDSEQAAHFMFNHCKKWLQAHGIEAMDGPINFGERLNWWGLVVEGFHAPLYGMNYNPPYYQRLFESYGFKVYFYQHCYSISLIEKLPSKFYSIQQKVETNDQIKAVPFSKRKLNQFACDFVKIYNKSWKSHGENKVINEVEAIKLFTKMKAVIAEKAIWFVYHLDEPIACWLNLPDLNVYFKSMNGKFGIVEIIKFLLLRKVRPNQKLVGLLFGVVPEFQHKGIDAFMIVKALQTINDQTPYRELEMQWIGDFNPKMINMAQNMGAKCTRKLATYRYLFDQDKPFTPHPLIG